MFGDISNKTEGAKMESTITRRNFIKTSALTGLGFIVGCTVKNRFDIIIRNGNILNGLGTPAARLDIGIKSDKIASIDDLSSSSADIFVDAKDLIVAPGFIDIHTHTDTELLVNPKAESKIRQGITTEVSGNCGYSPFPLNREDRKELNEKLVEQYGIEITWNNIDGFFKAIESSKTSINYMSFSGHGNLRAYVVGKNDVTPTKDQMDEMKRILAQSMEFGSLGLSTGLEYAPGSYAKTEELIELCKVVSQHNGIYATHMRNEDDTVEEAIEEALRICAEANVSLQISHLKACNQANWHKVDHMLEMIHNAADKGLPVLADRYPYSAWGTGLTSFLPLWTRQGGTEEILARLKEKKYEAEISKYSEERGKRIGGWNRVVISLCYSKKNKKWEGKSIQSCSEITGKEPCIFIRELLIEERNRVGVIGFAMDEDNLKKVLAFPLITIGSDGSAVAPYGKLGEGKPHPRYYGTFPRILGKYCREERIFDLPTAIEKMTSMSAKKLGINKRGILKKGYFADITIFNPKTIIDNATYTNPHQYPTGIKYVIVNGKLTIKKGKHTGELKGEVLRHYG